MGSSIKGAEGCSKASKAPKKKKQVEKPQAVEEEMVKETIPTKYWVLKWTKKPVKKSSASLLKTTTLEPVLENVEPTGFESSNPGSFKRYL